MSEVKQVKVDNWGVYFLKRLKHFFNRTDYCDLTLQFQDNAQLKVHRLVLSACTEYFELLERTCEMYEDCLVMPDDLQADVVVPIVNFMYTGQLEFKMELLDKLHQTSEIMSMPVLSKLLDSHRPKTKVAHHSYSPIKRAKRIGPETIKNVTPTEIVTTSTVSNKRPHGKAFEQTTIYRDKKVYLPLSKRVLINNGPRTYREPSPIPLDQRFNKKIVLGDPRPTRYEVPEELDTDNIFENSFCNISYTSQPLMVHPETRKQYAKRPRLLGDPSGSRKLGLTTVDIIECKKPDKISNEDFLFEESIPMSEEAELFSQTFDNVKTESPKDTSQLFDQILDQNESSKITIETKNTRADNLDHAKIISDVLRKYPHLVKSNKNIKLKIFNSPGKNIKKQKASPVQNIEKAIPKTEKECDYTFETDVIDSKQAAKLIALGAENFEGPWICLICGTPGRAMNFTSYYKFRRHLVEVHREKPVLNICEYCGQKSTKRNYILHHMYTKHGVEPPPQYHFPKCNNCNYIALTEALLIKHKASHVDNKNFRCNVCPSAFNSSSQLLIHIRNTGHKYSADRKTNLLCIYCQKVFMREGNLFAHLKSHHKNDAVRDGIIDDCDEEPEPKMKNVSVKSEPSVNDFEELDIQYQIQQRSDGNIHVVTKKHEPTVVNPKQKILNAGLTTAQVYPQKNKTPTTSKPQPEYIQEINNTSTFSEPHEEIVIIDDNEYILRDNQLIPRISKPITEEYILADQIPSPTSMEFTNIHNSNIQENVQSNVLLKTSGELSQPIPIYVSDEEQYTALIASNQSIIVDRNDPNKMLTVLTAPHTSTLETTSIDLDNAQSSEMMIIQDEFPLVSKAPDNSNIVVVYSQQIGDQNKQYQLLTTQGLEAQFVQTSAILTQNYETITTTSPVINASTSDKQVIWHNNIHQIINNNEIEITPVSEIQTIVDTNEMQIVATAEPESHIDELPDVDMNSDVAHTTTIITSDTTTAGECEDIAEEIPSDNVNLNLNKDEQLVVSNTQNISHMEVDEGLIEEQLSEEAETIENVPEETVNEEEEENVTTISQTESEEMEEEQSPTEIASESFIQSEDVNIANQTPELQNIEQTLPELISNNSNSVEQELIAEDNNEKPAEWTEDNNMDVNQVDETVGDATDDIPTTNAEICDKLEESIENIQQEVNKHVTQISSATEYEENTNNESISSQNEDLNNTAISSQEESDQEITVPEITGKSNPVLVQEKISSLLNDWDDSQEDSATEIIPSESVELTESTPVEPVEEVTSEKGIDKPDNIRSLVSDWDEEDDENRD